MSKEKLRALLNSALPRLRPKTSGFKQGRQLRYLSMFGVCSVPSSVLLSNHPQVAQLPALLKTIGFKRGGTEFSKAHSFALLKTIGFRRGAAKTMFYFPNSVSTLRGSYGPVLNRGGSIRVRPIPRKFHYKMALVTCP